MRLIRVLLAVGVTQKGGFISWKIEFALIENLKLLEMNIPNVEC